MPKVEIFTNDPHVESHPSGHHLFKIGDHGEAMYVVVEGEVEISLPDRVVEVVGPGGIFGEMALVEHKERSANAIAATDCKVVPINEKRFTYLVQNTPFFAIEVMQTMAARLRRMDESV